MTTNFQHFTASPLCAGLLIVLGAVAVTPAQADDRGMTLFGAVNAYRVTCGPVRHHPQLATAAQRHANDMLNSGATLHTGSDGSIPESRITDAGVQSSRDSEIVYVGTGSAATPEAAVDWWMNQSPPHRAIILDCGLTAAGAATASDGNRMTAVVDFIA